MHAHAFHLQHIFKIHGEDRGAVNRLASRIQDTLNARPGFLYSHTDQSKTGTMVVNGHGIEVPHGLTVALNDVNIDIPAGQMNAVLGVSGSGKSTLLNLLLGVTSPEVGNVSHFGNLVDYGDDEFMDEYRSTVVGCVFQTLNLIGHLSAWRNVALSLVQKGSSWKDAKEYCCQLLEEMQLSECIWSRKPRNLSGGERQRVAMARVIARQPQIILADEPTGSLDSRNSIMVMELLKAYQQKSGCTVILVTHNNSLAFQYCRQTFSFNGTGILQAVHKEQQP